MLGPQQFGGRAGANFALMQPDDLLGVLADEMQVVGDQQDGQLPLLMNLGDESHEGLSGGGVHAGGRLVKHEDVGFGGQGAGDEHALLLAAGKLGKPLAGEVGRAGGLQAFAHEGALAWRDESAGADPPVDAHERDVVAGDQEKRVELGGLGHVAENGGGAGGRGSALISIGL